MRWFASIVLNMILAAAAHADPATDVQQGTASAATAGATMRSYSGTGTALSANLIAPLTQAKQITTADGQTKFITNGLQASGTPLIQITLTPEPATGDLKNIIIQQDLTASGTLGYAQIFPMSGDVTGQKISGVCQNGYIQCDPNFTNCQYRAWQSGSSGAVTAVTANGDLDTAGSVSGLAGCYCFNNFCTGQNNALIELGAISSDVGGGILSAFLAANTGMTISSASSNNNAAGSVVLSYYGYKPTAVTLGSTAGMTQAQIDAMPVLPPADSQTPQTFYNDSASLNNSAQNALTAQKNAPNSLYNIVTNAATSQSGSNVTCANTKSISILSSVKTLSQTGSSNLAIDDHFTWSLTETSKNAFVFTGIDNKGLPLPNITYTFQPTDTLGGYVLQSVSFVGGWPAGSGGCDGVFSLNPIWTAGVGIGTAITGSTGVVCGAPGYQYPIMNWTFIVTYQTQAQVETDFNECDGYDSKTSCSIQQDVWDGRPVIVNGLHMNNRQLGQTCKTYPGPLQAVSVCKPWFVQERSYYCTNSATAYNFNQAKANAATIDNNATMPTSSSMRYIDPTQGGVTVTFDTSVAGPLPGCPNMCETKIPASQTGVLSSNSLQSATQTSSAQSASQYLFFYKECVETAGTWACPNDPAKGEVVLTQCGCSSDMGKALGALQFVGSSAEHSICSTN